MRSFTARKMKGRAGRGSGTGGRKSGPTPDGLIGSGSLRIGLERGCFLVRSVSWAVFGFWRVVF